MINSTLSLERLYKSSPVVDAPKPASPAKNDLPSSSSSGFADTMEEVGKSALSALGNAEKTAMSGMAGKADPHAVVEALAAAELALETAVSVRDKAVEAYQEILRMPV